MKKTRKKIDRGIISFPVKSEFGPNSWQIRIVFPKRFNIYVHAAKMARAEFGCVSGHELALLARLEPHKPLRR